MAKKLKLAGEPVKQIPVFQKQISVLPYVHLLVEPLPQEGFRLIFQKDHFADTYDLSDESAQELISWFSNR